MFKMVEFFHNKGVSVTWKNFWQIFLEAIDKKDIPFSGASEYELYLNFLVKNNSKKFKIRYLKWKNICFHPKENEDDSDYVSWHFYDRTDSNIKMV